MKQQRFKTMKRLRPRKPSRRSVADAVARQIITEMVRDGEFYEEDAAEREDELAVTLRETTDWRVGRLFSVLSRKYDNWGWEFQDVYLYDAISLGKNERDKAVSAWRDKYDVPETVKA